MSLAQGTVEFLKQMRERRIVLGLSQNDLDIAVGLTWGHCAKIESGARVPTATMQDMIAEALGFEIMPIIEEREIPRLTLTIADTPTDDRKSTVYRRSMRSQGKYRRRERADRAKAVKSARSDVVDKVRLRLRASLDMD